MVEKLRARDRKTNVSPGAGAPGRKGGRREANRCVSRGEGQLASLPPGSSGVAGGDGTRPSLLLGGWGSSFEFSRLLRRRGDPEGFVTAALGSGRAGV